MALGAGPSRLRAQVLHKALVPVWIGGAVEVLLALLGSRLVQSQLFEISPADPVALTFAGVVLVLAWLGAGYLQAARANEDRSGSRAGGGVVLRPSDQGSRDLPIAGSFF